LHVEKWETEGFPIIFFEKKGLCGGPKIFLYGHYDVQPASVMEGWSSGDPFCPIEKNGRVYARGAEDNKGQIFYTFCAIRAFVEKYQGNAPVTIKGIIEGEEEIGSPSLPRALSAHKEKLQADHIFFVDMGMDSLEAPVISLGCKGIMTMEVVCKNADIDVHSGSYGGIVYNPIRALVEVLSKIVDKNGKITIPGFYEDVISVSEKERQQLHINEVVLMNKMRQLKGIRCFHKETGYEIPEVNFFRPLFEINGISGGYVGQGFKTVIPKQALVKFSYRLVPYQDFQKIFQKTKSFFQKNLPREMHLSFFLHGGGEAMWASLSSKTIRITRKAYEEIFGSCKVRYSGGSIPISRILVKSIDAPFAYVGTALEEDNIHAPDENFGIDQIVSGFLLMLKIFELCSHQKGEI